MAKSPDVQVGYDFEDEIKKELKELQEKYPLFWHEFIDTKAAGRFVKSQPSDYLIKGKNTVTYLLEAKASAEKPSLRDCAKAAILPNQIGWHKKYHRAGGRSLFIFYCETDAHIELWDGKYVIDCISNGKKLDKTDAGIGLLSECSYFHLKELFITYFCI